MITVIRKNTPTATILARDLKDGQIILTNSGNVKEVTADIRRALPADAPVNVYVKA
jgi:hypothetical protein